ncbi:MAG: Outer rane lipoprotein carrier protein LolA [Myxococcaceae bacterium]|nr:Outer rane lipoprotein carrier protein LolA [Myxococcaceae bacterium]
MQIHALGVLLRWHENAAFRGHFTPECQRTLTRPPRARTTAQAPVGDLFMSEEHVTFQWARGRERASDRVTTSVLAVALLLGASSTLSAQAPAGDAKPSGPVGSTAQAGSPATAASATPVVVDAKAAQMVVTAVQTFYDQTKTVEAEFYQTYFNRIYDKYDHSKGSVKFAKPGRMRWDYAAPNGKVIVSDGKRLVIFEPGEESEPGQVFERAISDSELPQALAFLTGTGKLADDFTFRLLDAAAQGFPTGYVLELLPKKPSPHYERILFYVDAAAQRTGLVHRVLIVDSAGNRNRIDFKQPKFNRALDLKTFAWQPPKNARRVNP